MKIGVIGAGNWGTALANLLAGKGIDVVLWAYETDVVTNINNKHKNHLYLQGVTLSRDLAATNNLAEAVRDKDMIVFVAPSHVTRKVAGEVAKGIKKSAIFVSCTKGIEASSGKLVSNILQEAMPDFDKNDFCFLSGPSFAVEVAGRLPTAVVIASTNPATANIAQEAFRTGYFMPFTSDDTIGVQVGGAIKNIVAIACGISDGLGFGHNTRAATITRGLYEIIKIGQALGANPITFAGLAGIGDLVLTCTSELSRNRQLGFQVGKGRNIEVIQKNMKGVAEGVITAKAVYNLAKKLKLETPICSEVYKIIYEKKSPKKAVSDLTKMEIHEELKGVV